MSVLQQYYVSWLCNYMVSVHSTAISCRKVVRYRYPAGGGGGGGGGGGANPTKKCKIADKF